MLYEIFKTDEFESWFLEESSKSKFQILKRLQLIIDSGHFGTHKRINDVIWELK